MIMLGFLVDSFNFMSFQQCIDCIGSHVGSLIIWIVAIVDGAEIFIRFVFFIKWKTSGEFVQLFVRFRRANGGGNGVFYIWYRRWCCIETCYTKQ